VLARVNGVDIFFDVAGYKFAPDGESVAERPTVILLHGGPGMDHMVFKPAFDRLSNHAQVIYYDHRACGRSDTGPADSWHIDQWADDIAAFIDQLGLDRPIVLGTSFGGMVAQRFAAKHPDVPGGLVLMSTTARVSVELTLAAMEKKGGVQAREAAQAFFSDAAQPGVVDRYLESCLGYYTVGTLDAAAMARVIMRNDVMMHFFRRGGEYFSVDLREELTKITVPTLIVHGEDDPVFPIALAEETMECLNSTRKLHGGSVRLHAPRSRLVRLPLCGHLSEQDAPDAILDAILNFFEF